MAMKKTGTLIGLLSILLMSSCTRNSRLEQVFALAGDNRGELEAVVDHYSRNTEDSLKLKAAIFLIENMPGHYSYHPDSIAVFREAYMDIFNKDIHFRQKQQEMARLSGAYPNLGKSICEDARIISSEYLIHNIEKSFEIWETSLYCQHLCFDEFCELILPYKCIELQEFDYWKDSLAGKYNESVDMILPNDENYANPYNVSVGLSLQMKNTLGVNHVHDYNGYTLFNSRTLWEIGFGTCENYSLAVAAVMRSKGIPACLESLPQWSYKKTGHGWHTIMNDNGAYLPCPWNLESMPGTVFFPHQKMPKIFRHTYARDPFMEEYFQECKIRLPKFSLFKKDVTGEYVATTDVEVPIETKGLDDNKYAYIATFDTETWNVVYPGKIKNGKVRFENMGRGMAYIVLGCVGDKQIPISEPFLITSRGELVYCTPDNSDLQTVAFTRKFPKNGKTAVTENYMIGGRIEGANKADFSDADTLYVIENLDYPDLIPVDTSKKYRYWRYIQTEPTKMCALAEFQIYKPGEDRFCKEAAICSAADPERAPEVIRSIFDDDWLSTYSARGAWVGLDLGEPTSIEKIRVVPRSDDNGIHYGDNYELKYWHNGKWISLGKQTATGKSVTFDNIPANALLLLSNNTRGKQETVFTYRDGKQKWW